VHLLDAVEFLDHHAHALGILDGGLQIRAPDAGLRIAAEGDFRHVGHGHAALAQAVLDRVHRKQPAVLVQRVALLLAGRHQLAVHHQRRRRVVREILDS
jgi:hypothetical protein